jgi:hypothetical protein
MVAVFSQPDAIVWAAFAAVIPATVAAVLSFLNGRKLRENGGSSPVDAINRIERKVDGLYAKHDEHARRLEQLEEYVTNPPAGGHVRRRKETS